MKCQNVENGLKDSIKEFSPGEQRTPTCETTGPSQKQINVRTSMEDINYHDNVVFFEQRIRKFTIFERNRKSWGQSQSQSEEQQREGTMPKLRCIRPPKSHSGSDIFLNHQFALKNHSIFVKQTGSIVLFFYYKALKKFFFEDIFQHFMTFWSFFRSKTHVFSISIKKTIL